MFTDLITCGRPDFIGNFSQAIRAHPLVTNPLSPLLCAIKYPIRSQIRMKCWTLGLGREKKLYTRHPENPTFLALATSLVYVIAVLHAKQNCNLCD